METTYPLKKKKYGYYKFKIYIIVWKHQYTSPSGETYNAFKIYIIVWKHDFSYNS